MRTRSLLPRSEGSGVEFPAERSSFGAARLSSAADDASRDLDRTIHTKDSKKQTNKASGSGHKGSSGHAGRSPLPRSEEEVGPCGRSSAGRCVSPVASRRVAAGATTGLQQALAFALYKLAQVLRRRHTLLRWTLRGDHGLDALLLLLLVTATRRSSAAGARHGERRVELDVEMGTSACGPGGVQRKTLALTLNDVLLENTGFSKFHSGQPDGGNGENCLVLVKSSKQLADAPCSWKLPYICKANL
ncbi:Protein of unknown function [Gryllus bimaculatus]|nr:Protein of unknown function [Gryllus bimaculatus]